MIDILDIRDWKQTGMELKTEISNAVAATQSVVIQPLPNKLIMTQAQYDMLESDPDLVGVEPKERIYITPHNAMDVIISEVDDNHNVSKYIELL